MSGRRPLTVAMLPMLPAANAATRAFCIRPKRYLAEDGIEATVLPPSGNRAFGALAQRRGPLRRITAAVYWYALVLPRRLVQLQRAARADVIFVQRSLFRYSSPPLLEALLWLIGRHVFGRPLVYHCDDALYAVAPKRWYDLRFRHSDLVLTGNREIAAVAERAGGSVEIWEGAVDVPRYPVRRHDDRQPFVIGWVGHHPPLLRPLVPALAQVCARGARVHVVGDVPLEAPELGDALTNERWRPEREFEVFRAFDVGIMPLEDTEYDRGKEGFKIKEYMAAGLPVVCSPIGHNLHVVEDGVTGLFASTEDQWVAALGRLMDDVELRARLGTSGRTRVELHWSLRAQAERLAEILRHLAPVRGAEEATG